MILSFPVLIKRNLDGRFISFLSPDLGVEFQFDNKQMKRFGMIPHAAKLLKTHLDMQISQGNQIYVPKKLKEYQNIPVDKDFIWTKLFVNVNRKPGLGEKAFYWGASIANLFSIVTWAFMTVLALQISSSENGKALGITSAIISIPISVIVYKFSGTANAVSVMGAKIDKLFRKKQQENDPLVSINNLNINDDQLAVTQSSRPSLSYKATTALILGGLSLGGSLLVNTSAINYTTFFDLTLLNERAQETGTVFDYDFIETLIYILVFTTFLAKLTFDGNFTLRALEVYKNWLAEPKNKKSSLEVELLNNNEEDAGTKEEKETMLKI
jgi:hypothetical protein